ncbi:MAG: hypothetical protein JNN15_17545 [Blastocatellia bacterium]|nr:hypothetical protein [Blastocatellia bacterium]
MSLYIPKKIKNTPIKKRKQTPYSWRVFFAIFLGCLVAYGFVSAARYHFSAIEIGYKTEELKKQLTELEVAQRKLQLELSKKTSPWRIDKKAQKQGLSLPSTRQAVAVRRGELGESN